MATPAIDPQYTPWYKQYGNVPQMIDYPELTMYEIVRETAGKYPEKIAYEFMNRKVKYKTFLMQIDHIAKCLVKEGVTPADNVMICMPNCPQAVIAMYAINKIGGVAVMVHPLSAPGEIEYYVKDSESRVVLTLDMFYAKFPPLGTGKMEKIIVSSIADELKPLTAFVYKHFLDGKKDPKVDTTADGLVSWKQLWDADVSSVPEPVSPKNCYDGAVILYTGGTTGVSKGALLSSMSFNSTALGMTALSEIYGEGEIMLAVMPIFHGFGLCACVHLPFCVGITSVLVPRFTPDSYSKLIVKKKANFIAGVPTLYEHMIRSKWLEKADLSCLRGIFCGGDTLTIEAKERMDAFLKAHGCTTFVREGFGCTECLTATTITPKTEQRPGSIGVPMPNVYYKIVKPDTEERMPYGEDGEICLSAPAVMIGYYNDPEETAKVLRKHSDGLTWLHTRDVGCMDEDGFIYFKQRIKRIIITSGYNVYPSHVENVLNSNPMVKESCVIGIPDQLRGNKVKAYIVLEDGVKADAETEAALDKYSRQNISKFAIPRAYEFIDELPRTKVAKIDYRKLEDLEAERRKGAN